MLSGDGPGMMTKGMRMLGGDRGGEHWQNGMQMWRGDGQGDEGKTDVNIEG